MASINSRPLKKVWYEDNVVDFTIKIEGISKKGSTTSQGERVIFSMLKGIFLDSSLLASFSNRLFV